MIALFNIRKSFCFSATHESLRGRRSIVDLLKRIDDPIRSSKVAVINSFNGSYATYGQLSAQSSRLAQILQEKLDPVVPSLGCYIGGHADYVIAMLATWRLGKKFVPLSVTHSEQELSYFVQDSSVGAIFHSSDGSKSNIDTLKLPLYDLRLLLKDMPIPANQTIGISKDNFEALVLYTSGTTGRPKGAVHSMAGLQTLIESLSSAWEYDEKDKILHFLPLHHLHGVLNKLLCVLYAGGTIEFVKSAKPEGLWRRLAAQQTDTADTLLSGAATAAPLTMFMGVPTVYARMIELTKSDDLEPEVLLNARKTLRTMRLNACGSAALPDTVMDAWKDLTGQVLLERYGMTELGMILSNPLKGTRRKGCVGHPLPGVQCRIVDEENMEVTEPEIPGELRVKGPGVFKGYLNLPEVTAGSFDSEGWFKTGDIALVTTEGDYRLLGRSSSDIIKSGGYKLSALEIERELLAHPQIAEAAVVGKVDQVYGENVAAVIVLRAMKPESIPALGGIFIEKNNTFVALKAIREFLKTRLAPYKQPKEVFVVDSLPRNHLGKVNKKTLLSSLGLLQP